MRRPLIAAALVSTMWGCNPTPRMNSCADPIKGVWRGDDGKRYHAVEERGRVDIYPMFNASRIDGDVDYAPFMFGFSRLGDALVGKRTQRATRNRHTCTIRTQAAIRSCKDNTLTLRYRPMTTIDWARCKPEADQPWVTLTLKR